MKEVSDEEWKELVEWINQLQKINILVNSVPDKVWEGLKKIK